MHCRQISFVICPRCGTILPYDTEECPECHLDLTDPIYDLIPNHESD
jgi:RNA polymerase subunit RPABC4/transcription elongation factor Spt4